MLKMLKQMFQKTSTFILVLHIMNSLAHNLIQGFEMYTKKATCKSLYF